MRVSISSLFIKCWSSISTLTFYITFGIFLIKDSQCAIHPSQGHHIGISAIQHVTAKRQTVLKFACGLMSGERRKRHEFWRRYENHCAIWHCNNHLQRLSSAELILFPPECQRGTTTTLTLIYQLSHFPQRLKSNEWKAGSLRHHRNISI